jgi:type IV pilus assembly protein PilC
MAFIFTPGQLARRAEFYHQLSQMTAAGLTIMRTLEQLEQHPPAASYRTKIRRTLHDLGQGYSLTEAFRRVPAWLPEFDTALIQAGEHSGRLDSCFKLLANYYGDRARIARQVIGDLLYPLLLLHMAIFIFPFVQLAKGLFNNQGGSNIWLTYFLQTFGILIPLYLLVFLTVFLTQSGRGEKWRAWIEVVLQPVPLLGTARYYLSLARLCAALEALISAGVLITQAWEMAATACGSPAIKRTVMSWRRNLDSGNTPAELVSDSHRFPELFAGQYASGEISGKLEETLKRLHEYYQEEGTRKLRAFSQWSPRLIYFLIAIIIGYKVVRFWVGYFNQISNTLGGF